MKLSRGYLLLALPIALSGCGGDDDATVEIAGDTSAFDAAMSDPMVTTPAPVDAAPMDGAVMLAAVGGSGVTGQATLTEQGAQTQVMVQLTGLSGSGTHPGHIHQGSCDPLGAVVVPLQDVTAANGSGSSTSTISVDMATAMNGQHVIAYHSETGTPIVCGAIPGHTM